jgi:CheY-like chemotaxis protein
VNVAQKSGNSPAETVPERKRVVRFDGIAQNHYGLSVPGACCSEQTGRQIAGAHMAVVLIAEDDEDIAVILTRLLKRAGHTVLHEPDGQAALESAVAKRPDIVLTDLGMPRMDGLELTRELRSHPDLSEVPIIMLSGQLHPGDSQPAEAGVCAVLLKPCPNDRVVAAVNEVAQSGPHQHGAAAECPGQRVVTA